MHIASSMEKLQLKLFISITFGQGRMKAKWLPYVAYFVGSVVDLIFPHTLLLLHHTFITCSNGYGTLISWQHFRDILSFHTISHTFIIPGLTASTQKLIQLVLICNMLFESLDPIERVLPSLKMLIFYHFSSTILS